MSLRSGALRYFATIKNGTTPASGEPAYWDGEIAWATPDDLGRLEGTNISETKRTVTQIAVAESNLNVVPTDTVLMSTRAPIGHMAITTRPMTFNQGCRALIPRDGTWGPYLLYLLKSRVPELNESANGTTFVELSRDDLAEVRISLPPLKTQKRIAAFLDEKTAQIDRLIEKKRALLDRLAEKRQAIITQAVTKGLNPAVPMEDSGIDWLGQIPAHWEVKRLRFLVKLLSGATPTTGNAEYWDGDINWISPKDMKSDEIVATIDKVTGLAVENYGLKRFDEANVAIVIRGMILARYVPVAIASGVYTINQDMKIMKSKGETIPWYVQMYFAAIQDYLMTLIAEAGHGTKALRTDVLMDTPILLPPLGEQAAIVDAIKRQKAHIDDVGSKVTRFVAHLTEYRSALMTAAVTGQLEV